MFSPLQIKLTTVRNITDVICVASVWRGGHASCVKVALPSKPGHGTDINNMAESNNF